MSIISLSYYQNDDVVHLSRSLIGKYLFTHIGDDEVTGGMIIETEAYAGAIDKASHAYGNRRTKRTEVMFKAGGVGYVYLCYGMHYLFNIVTNRSEKPDAILIRALKPEVGLDTMIQRRKKKQLVPNLTSGPGSVCQALGINHELNGVALNSELIWLEDRGVKIPSDSIVVGPRIGIDYAQEDALNPWRFYTKLTSKTLEIT